MGEGLPFAALKPYLAEYAATHLEKSPKAGPNMYECPACGSGTGAGGTGGLHIDAGKGAWYCHAHGEGGDITQLHAMTHGLSKGDAVKELAAMYGLDVPAPVSSLSSTPNGSRAASTAPTGPRGTVTPLKAATPATGAPGVPASVDYGPWLAALASTRLGEVPAVVAYLAARGLTVTAAEKVGAVVFDASNPAHLAPWRREWGQPPKARLALVFPYAGGHYWQARLLEGPRNAAQRWDKPGEKVAGRDPIYGADTLTLEDTRPLVFVEGIPDALAVEATGGRALATGTSKLEGGAALALAGTGEGVTIVEALDNDGPGRAAATKLGGLLPGRAVVSLWGQLEDADSAAGADLGDVAASVGVEALGAALGRAGSPLLALEGESVGATLAGFMRRVKDAQAQPVTKTGLQGLDDALEGGLVPGLYIVGAQSSVGKTTLALQVGDYVAASGARPVVIFSLEQGRDELTAKSLSRLMRQRGTEGAALSASNIRFRGRDDAWTLEQGAALEGAITAYGRAARRLWIFEGVGDLGAEDVEREARRVATVTGTAPLVIIDYLQILAPHDPRATDKQATDKAVTALKRISRDLGAPVLAVSSLNRASYSGPVTMAAFKESGAVEYGSDVLLGVQPAGLTDKETQAAATENARVMKTHKQALNRDVEVVILKNRNGPTGATVPLKFEPLFSLFTDRVDEVGAQYRPRY